MGLHTVVLGLPYACYSMCAHTYTKINNDNKTKTTTESILRDREMFNGQETEEWDAEPLELWNCYMLHLNSWPCDFPILHSGIKPVLEKCLMFTDQIPSYTHQGPLPAKLSFAVCELATFSHHSETPRMKYRFPDLWLVPFLGLTG